MPSHIEKDPDILLASNDRTGAWPLSIKLICMHLSLSLAFLQMYRCGTKSELGSR